MNPNPDLIPSANPTGTDVDGAIAAITQLIDQLGNDLYDLENNNPTRIILASASLSGRTASLAAEADDYITLLWAFYGPAREALSGVVQARGTRPSPTRAQIDELTRLLSSSVVLPPDAIALAQRLLPGAALTSPTRLDLVANTMSWALQQVTARLGQVTAVWDSILPGLADQERSLAEVEQAARAVGDRVPNEIAVGRRTLDELRQAAGTDPLSVEPSVLDEVAANVERARQAVADATASDLGQDQRMAAVGDRLTALDELLAATERIRQEVATKILSSTEADGGLDGARAELIELHAEWVETQAAADDRSTQQAARVARADRRSDALMVRLGQLHASAEAQLADRDELRGRLGAYRAKAYALGRGEDADLDALHGRATDVLYQAPCDLDEARRALEAYQQAVSGPNRTEDR